MQTVSGDALTHESVKVRRTVFVTGTAPPTVEDPFVLGPMDSIVPAMIPITSVFIFPKEFEVEPRRGDGTNKTTAPTSSVIHLEQLHVALTRVLDYYPHLGGRLHVLPTGTRVVKTLQAGAGLVEAYCTQSLASLKAARPVRGAPDRLTLFQLPADGNALLAPYDFSSLEALAAQPILTVQYTRFACGGVAIGIRMLHTVTDASGFFLFARHLAELYRKITIANALAARERGDVDLGSICLADPPAIVGFGAGDEPPVDPHATAHLPSLYRLVAKPDAKEAEASVRQRAGDDASSGTAALPRVCGRELFFSERDLVALKAQAVDSANADGWVSSFEALTALLWQRTYMAQYKLSQELHRQAAAPTRTTPSPPPSSYLTSFNVRGELQSRGVLPLHYFPNAVTTPIVTLSDEALLSGVLSHVATPLHALVRHSVATKGDYWTAVSRWMNTLADKTCFESDFNGGVMTSQWNKMDMYDGVSFVENRPPALVATTFTPISLVDGLGYFVPDRQPKPEARPADVGEGGLTVYYALAAPVWKLLEEDPAIAPHIVADVDERAT